MLGTTIELLLPHQTVKDWKRHQVCVNRFIKPNSNLPRNRRRYAVILFNGNNGRSRRRAQFWTGRFTAGGFYQISLTLPFKKCNGQPFAVYETPGHAELIYSQKDSGKICSTPVIFSNLNPVMKRHKETLTTMTLLRQKGVGKIDL